MLLLSALLAASLLGHAARLFEVAPKEVPAEDALERVTHTGDAARAFGAAEDERPAPPIGPAACRRGARRAEIDRADPLFESRQEAQAGALCRVAKRSLREKWQAQKDDLVSSLRRSLADEPEQAKAAAKTSASMVEVLALDEADALSLESEVARARAARVAAARAALQAEPADLAAVLDEARDLFEAEDDIARAFAGTEGAAAWREHELESRTVVLALLASLADLDESEALAW